PEAPDASHPRSAILSELSGEQYQIYRATQSAENYFTAENLEGLELPQAKIRETLTLLAAAGLILEVGLPTPSGNATVYTTAYRALRSRDDAREADLKLLPQESV
ncbi:MAG: hypothetical protein O7E52_18230, partial [Candidatus Poribacteria bacterium]|nr:hypothetical protein [Candidatus Poribacteria bacterium]